MFYNQSRDERALNMFYETPRNSLFLHSWIRAFQNRPRIELHQLKSEVGASLFPVVPKSQDLDALYLCEQPRIYTSNKIFDSVKDTKIQRI